MRLGSVSILYFGSTITFARDPLQFSFIPSNHSTQNLINMKPLFGWQVLTQSSLKSTTLSLPNLELNQTELNSSYRWSWNNYLTNCNIGRFIEYFCMKYDLQSISMERYRWSKYRIDKKKKRAKHKSRSFSRSVLTF